MVLLAEGVPVKVAADATQNFKVTPMMLENATTDKTRMLILNSPCNPTGAVYTDREFMQILRWPLARNIFLCFRMKFTIKLYFLPPLQPVP